MPETIQYGLMTLDGELARFSYHGYHDGYYTLSDNKNDPVWLVSNPEYVSDTLYENVPYYNSNYNRPSWGPFKRNELLPAKLTSILADASEVNLHLNVSTLNYRDLLPNVLKMYTKTVETTNTYFVGVLSEQTVEELKPYIGKIVCFDSLHNKRKVLDVIEVPDEYPREVICEAI